MKQRSFIMALLALLALLVSILPLTAQDSVTCNEGLRVIEHAMGATCVTEDPQRVVMLDTGEIDNALALGAPVVGAPIGDVLEYQAYLSDQLDGIVDTGTISEPNLEVILSLNPDLILGSKQRYEAIYDQLSAIAPTVFVESLRVPWQDNFLLHAEALDREAEAVQLLAGYEAHVADVQAVLGDALGNTTISIIRFRPGQVRLYLKSSFIGYILQDVGLPRPPAQDEDAFSSEISLEQVQDVDADYIFITGYADDDSDLATFLESPLWQTLSAVQNERAIDIDDDTWIAGLGVQAANLVLDDLATLLAGDTCESGAHAVEDATGVTVCLPEAPQRIVALSEVDIDSLLALSVEPLAVTNGRGQQTPPRFLEAHLPDAAVSTGTFFQPNLEVILDLQPDLILFAGFTDPDVLAQLNAIAPVYNAATFAEPWQTHIMRLGDALNFQAEAEAVIAEYDARIKSLRDALGENANGEFVVVRWSAEGPQIMAPRTISSMILMDLGLTPPSEIPELEEGHAHTPPLSLETLDLIDVDWAFVGTLEGEGDAVDALEATFETPLFQTLEIVQNNNLIVIDGSIWTSVGGYIGAMTILDDIEAAVIGGE